MNRITSSDLTATFTLKSSCRIAIKLAGGVERNNEKEEAQ